MNARAYLAGAAVLMLVSTGCGGGDDTTGQPTGTPGVVNVELKEYSVTPTPASAAAGSVSFTAKNSGTMAHELVVIKSDLAPDKLPVKAGVVDEAGTGVQTIGEIKEFTAGTSANGRFDLTVGNYVLICNIAGHYQLGMRSAFKVT